jgi:hypothetical protein
MTRPVMFGVEELELTLAARKEHRPHIREGEGNQSSSPPLVSANDGFAELVAITGG